MPDSSTETAGSPVEETITDVNAEAPSTPEQDKGVGSMLDAVNSALAGPEAPPASEVPGSKDPAKDSPKEAVKPADSEISEEELANMSKGAQRRIRELVEAKKTVEAQFEPLRQELDTIKPKAERLDQITGYMHENAITPEHLNNALGLTALINTGQYRKALPVLEALMNQVRQAAGEVLPAELKSKVDLGYITEHDAMELNRAKVAVQTAEQREQQRTEQAETERQQREVQTLVTTATNTAEAWNSEQVKSDPDWNQKRDLVTEGMELELLRLGPSGYPRTAKDVRAMLDKVKSSVEARIGKFRPSVKPITPVVGGVPSPRSAAAPKTMLDAVNLGLERAHGG